MRAESTLQPRQSVSQHGHTQSVSHGDDGLLLDSRVSRLIGEHDSQVGPPVSPLFACTALGTERHHQNFYWLLRPKHFRNTIIESVVTGMCEEFFWMLYHGYGRDSPRQQLEECLEGITGRQLASKPAKRADFVTALTC